jgi:hypothetical protein
MIKNAKTSFIVLAITTVMAVVGSTSASWAFFGSGRDRGGFVTPCSLVGVNPVYHPGIFGNPAVAASYGFVRTRSGWQVRPDCMRGETVPY